MSSRFENDDYHDISFEEFDRIICNSDDEEDINIDSFIAMVDQSIADDELYEEIAYEEDLIQSNMHEAMRKENYQDLFSYSIKLSKISYAKFKREIDSSIEKCAKNGVVDALIFLMEKYTVRGNGTLCPEAFPVLKKLSDIGYIKSFQWLGDCYYYGIGCERDLKLANNAYFEGDLFGESEHCKTKMEVINKELREYKGNDFFQSMISDLLWNHKVSEVRLVIAEMIIEGKLKDYQTETAILLLKESDTADGYSYYRLAECFSYGIGTSIDYIKAYSALEWAEEYMKWYLPDTNEECRQLPWWYLENRNYNEDYKKILQLQEEAKIQISKLTESGEIKQEYSGDYGIEMLYENWCCEETLFIKRKTGGN
ncbi:MAG: hypothetical protein K5894_11065 [Lachnospiraceae bacterium]|nr:hypothetical protein [Lachnospiraceae bacterium]